MQVQTEMRVARHGVGMRSGRGGRGSVLGHETGSKEAPRVLDNAKLLLLRMELWRGAELATRVGVSKVGPRSGVFRVRRRRRVEPWEHCEWVRNDLCGGF